jgi:hypothetical protein
MLSLLAVMRTGEQIKTAIVGREGVVGAADRIAEVLGFVPREHSLSHSHE